MGPAISTSIGLLLIGALCAAIAHETAHGSLSVNSAIGIRTAATKRSPEAWRAGHLAARPWLLAAAWTALGAAPFILALGILGLDEGAVLLAAGIAFLATVTILVVGTGHANRAARATL